MTIAKKAPGKVKVRCGWAGEDPTYCAYHDSEWGVPVYDDQRLFEFLVLEGAQAGLSWITILRKRDAYRKAFAHFDPEKVARFNQKKIEALMQDAGIVRNRLKIESAVKNARAFLKLQEELGRVPTHEEIARILNLPKKKLSIIKKAIRVYNSTPQTDQSEAGWSSSLILPLLSANESRWTPTLSSSVKCRLASGVG